MILFGEYLQALARRRDIRQVSNGQILNYRLMFHEQTPIAIRVYPLEPLRPIEVMSQAWPVPGAEQARTEFMRQALRFNRNALHHLHASIGWDDSGSDRCCLTWHVLAEPQPAPSWSRQLQVFGQLAEKAWSTLPMPGTASAPRPQAHSDGHMIFMP